MISKEQFFKLLITVILNLCIQKGAYWRIGLLGAVSYHHLELIRYLLRNYKHKLAPEQNFFNCMWILMGISKEGTSSHSKECLRRNFSQTLFPAEYELQIFNMAMVWAAYGGHKDTVDAFIQAGANDWNQGLIGAATFAQKSLVNFFIEQGGSSWNEALRGAAMGGDLDIVKILVENGANQWETALEQAAMSGHKHLIEYFAEKGAKDFNRALIGAIKEGRESVVDLLVSQGPDNFDEAISTAMEYYCPQTAKKLVLHKAVMTLSEPGRLEGRGYRIIRWLRAKTPFSAFFATK